MNQKKTYNNVGLIGRFKPLHKGSASMLEQVCEASGHVVIGIGSINKHDYRNPFTAEETKDMINLYLEDKYANYEIKFINDHGHENADSTPWKNELKEKMNNKETFFSGNPYVKELLKDSYEVVDAKEFSKNHNSPIKASMARLEMAKDGNWEQYVPEKVVTYIKENKLDKRLREEFGIETIIKESKHVVYNNENLEEEMRTVQGELK